ncbi:hypothetical protein EC973_002290 [Apophysomyces ossiformis]|uniref:Uncharacterized protein n=1 Tax=Apophysomyces ossiformis TaxID=679940 RepID=A0A8H7BIL5_9FUNG|nr:hypothetical protein EC973_002290 [Apophysomyces ossiformis]
MRKNLGTAMNDAANLYESMAAFTLDLKNSTSAVDQSLIKTPIADPSGQSMFTRVLSRTFSTQPEAMMVDPPVEHRDNIDDLCNKALEILTKLQVESTRLRNVSNEYYLDKPFHLLFNRRSEYNHNLRRAKRYSHAIDAMKRIVWPLVSFRLLLPLRSLNDSVHRDLTAPTKDTLENFGNALRIMRRLGEMLKDNQRPLSEHSDWYLLERSVTKGYMHTQNEIEQTMCMGRNSDMDGSKLLAYYGFLARCLMIWDGLKIIVEKLGPQVNSRCSSRVVLPERDVIVAQG